MKNFFNHTVFKRYVPMALVVVLVGAFFYFAGKSRAQSDTDIFGGTITQVTYCTCWYDPGEVIQVQPPGGSEGGGSSGGGESFNTDNSAGTQPPSLFGFLKVALAQSSINQEKNLFFSYYYSTDHDAYNIYEAEEQGTLGGYEQGGECLETSGYTCTQNSQEQNLDGTVDTIRGIGSSAEPADTSGDQ